MANVVEVQFNVIDNASRQIKNLGDKLEDIGKRLKFNDLQQALGLVTRELQGLYNGIENVAKRTKDKELEESFVRARISIQNAKDELVNLETGFGRVRDIVLNINKSIAEMPFVLQAAALQKEFDEINRKIAFGNFLQSIGIESGEKIAEYQNRQKQIIEELNKLVEKRKDLETQVDNVLNKQNDKLKKGIDLKGRIAALENYRRAAEQAVRRGDPRALIEAQSAARDAGVTNLTIYIGNEPLEGVVRKVVSNGFVRSKDTQQGTMGTVGRFGVGR